MEIISGLPFLRTTCERVLRVDGENLDNHQLFSVSIMEFIQKLFIWELDYTGHTLFVVLTTEIQNNWIVQVVYLLSLYYFVTQYFSSNSVWSANNLKQLAVALLIQYFSKCCSTLTDEWRRSRTVNRTKLHKSYNHGIYLLLLFLIMR